MAASDIDRLKEQQAKQHHVSEHLANERTILAWIRTAIAVMTLGVGINRFSLFLVEFSHIVPGNATREQLLPAGKGFSGELVIGRDLMQIGVGQAAASARKG